MRLTIRAALFASVTILFGCKPETETAEQPTPESSESAPAATASLIEACKLKMTAPEAREWTTYWDPRGIPMAGEGPSTAHSAYWADERELEAIKRNGKAVPLDINCGADTPSGQVDIGVLLVAIGSTEADVPFGPGTYPVVGRSNDGSVKPGAFLAGGLYFGESMFNATGGTVKIERFDMNGVAGSFSVDATEMLMGNRPFHVEGTFNIPCRGRDLESKCTANKAIIGD